MSPRVLFEQELELLKNKVAEMGERAEISYDKLLYAINAYDVNVLQQLLDVDRVMLDMQRSIEAKCLLILTKQQPVARDLRTVSASLKVVTDIERIGDHVTDIAELFLRSKRKIDVENDEKIIGCMMEEAKEMLHASVESFVNGDTQAAKMVIDRDDVIDDYFNSVKQDMMDIIKMQQPDADKIVDLLMVAKYLEKIGDHAVNIGEWAIFQETGYMQEQRIL